MQGRAFLSLLLSPKNNPMKFILKHHLSRLADYSGLTVSFLCFVHCWSMPLLLLFMPALLADHELVHPVLCSAAIISTLPMVLSGKIRYQTVFFKFALVLGNVIMLVILLAHAYFPPLMEVLLNTAGGGCLMYVHYVRIKGERRERRPDSIKRGPSKLEEAK